MTYPLVKFGDVVRQVKDKVDPQTAGLERFVAGEHMDTDNLHIRRWGDVGAGYLGPAFHMRFKPGQILYGSRRTYLRKIAVADFEGITANTTYAIEPKDPEVLLPDFLPFVMSTERFHEHSIKQSKGSVNPYINFSDITWYEFPLPPVDEQRRISDLLWAADDVVEKNQEVVEKLLTIQKWKLDNWLIDGNLNSEWQEVKLDDICDVQNGQVDPKQPPYCDMIHIASDDIESGTGRILEMNTAAQDKVISGNYLFTEKAIVYSKIRPNLKKVVFPKFTGVCSADVYPIYPRENIIPELLFQLMLSETFTQYATSQSARSAIPKINRNGLLAFKFRLPPMEIQENIVQDLLAVFKSLEVAKQHVENSKTLKHKLLEKVLNT